MNKTVLSLGILVLLATPFASATGPVFCPPHNPNALTNACVVVNTGTTAVTHPYVNGFAPTTICIISNFCVTAPAPTLGTTTTNAPTANGSGTYVEVTVLCPAVRKCNVSWDDVDRILQSITAVSFEADVLA